MSATANLTSALQKQVLLLEEDLRARVEGDFATRGRWVMEHDRATTRGRTASSWQAWRDDRVTQVAVAWVLATVFVRFCEDNSLVVPVWIAGPEHRRQEALDAQLAFFRTHQEDTDREWLLEAVGHLQALPATAALVEAHSPLWQASPSGDAASALLAFWRQRGDDGALVHDLTDPTLNTRFLGDLYQDLSEHAKATYALLQTPVFVEEFILDRTLDPALAERPLEGFRMIDPTCGSGHFLLGAFARLLDRWDREAPGLEVQARVQAALDAIHGVDLNPFAVAIARFRLTVAALKACGLQSLADAPAFRFHLAVGDSLLHGPGQQTLHGDTDLTEFTYATEDLALLQEILRGGRYDAVVGNPPYITVKDKVLNQAYRERYNTCKGKYALSVPFMERFFGLAKHGHDGQPAGWTGQITSNSFMKREFGSKLVEEFLALKDLRLVADTSGASIPGHGTPTVIIVGRNQRPVGQTVRAVLGVRGEPGRPDNPAEGIVWRALVEHVDQPGWDDGWVTVADLARELLAGHPWSLSGGGAVELLAVVNEGRSDLAAMNVDIGMTCLTGEDEAFLLPKGFTRPGWDAWQCGIVEGDEVREYLTHPSSHVLLPNELDGTARESTPELAKHFWPYRVPLKARLYFGQTPEQRGKRWFDVAMFFAKRHTAPLSITFAFVATHNHFVLERGGKVFKQSAPVIKLQPGATEDDHVSLLGVLNSSTACFWLKQNSHNKGEGGGARVDAGYATRGEPFRETYEFTSTTLQDYPLPSVLPLDRGRRLDALAQELASQSPENVCAVQVPTASALNAARTQAHYLLSQMVSVQEELDWEVYRLYGVVRLDLTYPGDDLPGLIPGERSFEVELSRRVADGMETTSWFTHGQQTGAPITELPAHWPAAYRELAQSRLELIANDPFVRLLEKPEYKRRWMSDSWKKRQDEALRSWLLDRLEDRTRWFDQQSRPSPRSVAQLADEVGRDADLVSVLRLWEGRPDVPVTQSLVRLLADEAVPYLAAYRHKDTGLRKRESWEATWPLQLREDAGEQVGTIPVPPKYTNADFRKTSYWQARGKLDVPKERFVLYPHSGRETDPTPLIGWAGWDHAQQSLALSVVIGAREADGWNDERLVPLVAGLAELQPWVEQWHSDVDPAFGVSLASFCREQLTSRASQVGMTLEELAAWRPEPTSRGRKPREAS